MQPIKMVLSGRYWDSFLYKGRLYLFGIEGDIRSIVWDEFIYDWEMPNQLRIAFDCAFLRSDYLYSSDVQELLRDEEVKTLMQEKFARLSRMQLHASEETLEKFEKGRQENPTLFPHSDIEIYMDQLYVGSVCGLVRATCNKKNRHPISTRPEKKWDGPVLSMSASYGALALAAGREGLFELGILSFCRNDLKEGALQLSPISCRACSWAFFSIYASSDTSGYLAEFNKQTNGSYDRDAERKLERIECAEGIFRSEGFSWGVQDKLCQAKQNSIKVVKYAPWSREGQLFHELGEVSFGSREGEIVSASTANFGMIIELANALIVLPSDGQPVTIPGEPVNWRVFPRSRHYENQLHVLYEDRLEIFSFNHDYLVDQKQKLSGCSVYERIENRSKR